MARWKRPRTPFGVAMLIAVLLREIFSAFDEGRSIIGSLPSWLIIFTGPKTAIGILFAGLLLIGWEIYDIRRKEEEITRKNIKTHLINTGVTVLLLIVIVAVVIGGGFAFSKLHKSPVPKGATQKNAQAGNDRKGTAPAPGEPEATKGQGSQLGTMAQASPVVHHPVRKKPKAAPSATGVQPPPAPIAPVATAAATPTPALPQEPCNTWSGIHIKAQIGMILDDSGGCDDFKGDIQIDASQIGIERYKPIDPTTGKPYVQPTVNQPPPASSPPATAPKS